MHFKTNLLQGCQGKSASLQQKKSFLHVTRQASATANCYLVYWASHLRAQCCLIGRTSHAWRLPAVAQGTLVWQVDIQAGAFRRNYLNASNINIYATLLCG